MDIPANDSSIYISGLDTEKGLALYGNDQSVYFAILKAFASNAAAILEKLRHVTGENLADYAIAVHGLKGISAGIAAEELREMALSQEEKARRGELNAVLKGNPALLKLTEENAAAVKAWVKEFCPEKDRVLFPGPDLALLENLKDACLAYDMNEIDSIMELLGNVDYEKDASFITWLKERIYDLEFKKAASGIHEYLQKAKGEV